MDKLSLLRKLVTNACGVQVHALGEMRKSQVKSQLWGEGGIDGMDLNLVVD